MRLNINLTNLHPTTRQCSRHPREGQPDIDLAPLRGGLQGCLEPFMLELWRASKNGRTAYLDLMMNLSNSLISVILQSNTKLTDGGDGSFLQRCRTRSIIFVKLHDINQNQLRAWTLWSVPYHSLKAHNPILCRFKIPLILCIRQLDIWIQD